MTSAELLAVIDRMRVDIWEACTHREPGRAYVCDYCGHECGDNRGHAVLDPYCPVARALCAAQTALEKGSVE